MKTNKKAFTLVELIIVISMVAILGTISTISYLNNAKNSRDSSRVNDAEFISKAVELYYKKFNKYPLPESPSTVTYSGAELWFQGTFGDPTVEISGELEKAPYDPVYIVSYPYSISRDKDSYQVSYIIEGDGLNVFNKGFIKQTNAAQQRNHQSRITGNYNRKVILTKTGTTSYAIASPTLLASDLSDLDFMAIVNNKNLVYDKYFNVSHSYTGNNIVLNGGFDFIPSGSLHVYTSTGFFQELRTNETARLTLTQNLQNAYSGTIIASDVGRIVSTDIDLDTPSSDAKEISTYVAEKYMGVKVNK